MHFLKLFIKWGFFILAALKQWGFLDCHQYDFRDGLVRFSSTFGKPLWNFMAVAVSKIIKNTQLFW